MAFADLKNASDELRELAEAKLAEGEALGIAKGEAIGIAKGEAIGIAKGEALGIAKGEAIGIAKGKIAALIAILMARGIPVSTHARARIDACHDEATLDRWIASATAASCVEDVFGSPDF